jgi:hypothetical protein
MPNKDGTGPRGQGAGQGGGRGTGRARGGGGRSGAGFGGYCVCPNCGLKISHTPGQPCTKQICPDCNTKMVRGDAQ